MSSVVADTHTIAWYLADLSRLSPAADAALTAAIAGGDPVLVSTVTLVELTYLAERGRVPASLRQVVLDAGRRPDAGIRFVPFVVHCAEAMGRVPRDRVPDMPDRMIAATAVHLNLPLVTADHRIRTSGVPTIR
jgi:PIN domain nuclease of toxin-antitoxin system